MKDNTAIPRFVIGFPKVPEPVANVWHHLYDFLAAQKALPKTVKLSSRVGPSRKSRSQLEKKLPVDEVEKLILERGLTLTGFTIVAGSGSRSFEYMLNGCSDGSHQDFIMGCYFGKEARVPIPWNSLIEAIISEHPCVGAWQINNLYHAWQGNDKMDPYYEERNGELPPGSKTWTEPFSGPFLTPQPDIVTIDISRNPGRGKVLISRFSFYAGAEMWLAPHFWQYAKCTKEEALAANFFLEKRDTPHYLYLKCWPTPFTRPEGEQGRMQQRLWKLFFHEDCEWPPGSGTICDEPMYGPPELMPP